MARGPDQLLNLVMDFIWAGQRNPSATDVPKMYRKFFLRGAILTLVLGLSTGLLRTGFGDPFSKLIYFVANLSAAYYSVLVLCVVMILPVREALLLFLIGLLTFWASLAAGFTVGTGEVNQHVLHDFLTYGVLCGLPGVCLIPMYPYRVTAGEAAGVLSKCLAFRLSHRLIALTVVGALFAAAHVDRGSTRKIWQPIEDSGRSDASVEASAVALDEWLVAQGYVKDAAPITDRWASIMPEGASLFEPVDGARYHKAPGEAVPVDVTVRYSNNALRVTVDVEVPRHVLPLVSPEEREGDRVAAEINGWWRQHESEHP